MTKKQIEQKYIKELEEILEEFGGDSENLHISADKVLQFALEDLGYIDLVEAYRKCSEDGFWYS